MDNPKEPPTVLSFCSGYGGIELGLERVFGKITVLAHVEIEAHAIAVLLKNMETGQMAPAPIWTNVKTLPMEPFRGKVEILTGGYPCQPFSQAGRRLGEKDPRHLWPHIRRTIDIIRPRMCFFENVEGHITEGLYDVLDDLGSLGYAASWGIFSAVECGFVHQRQRVFILAYSNKINEQRTAKNRKIWESVQNLQENNGELFWCGSKKRFRNESPKGFKSKPLFHRRNDGVEDWDDRIAMLGNGVVPQTAEKAFKTLMKELINA